MTSRPDWRCDALTATLQALWPGLRVASVPEVASTNTALLDRARRGDESPCLLVADAQTAGRGRLGRSWWAAPGDSLTFSLGLPYAPADWSGLSLAVGLAVAEALDPGNAHIGLKWPNDLWLRTAGEAAHGAAARKLGGILIETTALAGSAAAAGARYAVIGIGLNVRSAPGDDPQLRAQFASGHAAVQDLGTGLDTPLDASATLHRVAPAVLRGLQVFARDGLAPLLTRYHARDALRGREVQAGETTGVAAGIDLQGQLLVQTNVCLAAIGSGEVSVRPC